MNLAYILGAVSYGRTDIMPHLTFVRLAPGRVPQTHINDDMRIPELDLVVRLHSNVTDDEAIGYLLQAEMEFYKQLFEPTAEPDVYNIHHGTVHYRENFWTYEKDERPSALRPHMFVAQVSYHMMQRLPGVVNNIQIKTMISKTEFRTYINGLQKGL
jgi:hypothetical protein